MRSASELLPMEFPTVAKLALPRAKAMAFLQPELSARRWAWVARRASQSARALGSTSLRVAEMVFRWVAAMAPPLAAALDSRRRVAAFAQSNFPQASGRAIRE